MFLTYKYRIKDGSAAIRRELSRQAAAVNYVWNYCCEIDRKAASEWRAGRNIRRPTAFDLINLTSGTSRELGLNSSTINAVCMRFVEARREIFPRTPNFRSRKRVLPWVPFNVFKGVGKIEMGILTLLKRQYHLWYSRPLPEGGVPKTWSICADARGRWYVNIQVGIADAELRTGEAIGIDLGIKTLATLSNGNKIEMPAFYRNAEATLGKYQKFGLKSRVRSLSAKVANQRKDYLHKVSTRLVQQYSHIVVGDVSASNLSKSGMGKSIHDASWGMLRNMILQKAIRLGSCAETVSEKYTSVTCSACGARSGPKGIAGLRIRDWCCESCGAVHDRDINAAQNILLGAERRPPVVEIAA